MIDETKVRVMTRLAAYEEGAGKKYLPIGQYFRTDYISMQLLKSFVCGTLAFVVVGGLLAFCNFETILEGIYDMDLVGYITRVGKIYIIFMALYLIPTYIWAAYKFAKAKKSLNSYISVMDKLSKKYYGEEGE
ncbi:MAG: hypothetical protein K5877_08505 [Lachnospiraceae bacterium]|nr:hypothetical protein [Lachnospiraceae bacterium]